MGGQQQGNKQADEPGQRQSSKQETRKQLQASELLYIDLRSLSTSLSLQVCSRESPAKFRKSKRGATIKQKTKQSARVCILLAD